MVPDLGSFFGLLAVLAIIGLMAMIGGAIYGVWWLVMNVSLVIA
jgi:hypothetical protein